MASNQVAIVRYTLEKTAVFAEKPWLDLCWMDHHHHKQGISDNYYAAGPYKWVWLVPNGHYL